MIGLLVIAVLLAFSAFFSAAETALFSLSSLRLEKMKKQNRRALGVERLKENGGVLLSGILMGNMLANLAISSFLAIYIERTFGIKSFWLIVILSSLFILVGGETIPKMVAFYQAESFSLFALPFLRFFTSLFLPFSRFVSYLSHFVFRVFFRKRMVLDDLISEEEFKVTLASLRDAGLIRPQEERMVKSVLEFNQTEAREIMTPRAEVQALDINDSWTEAERLVKESRHSYLVVFENTIDNVKGIVSAKDFFLSRESSLDKIIQEPYFVPESKKLNSLLRELQSCRIKLALVIDEYGGLAGIVTLEDILEEIFGEIYDEFEQAEEIVKEVEKGEYLVMAKIAVGELNMALGVNLPEEENTLAGLILNLIERFPKKGEIIRYGDLEFIIEKATARRIIAVRIRRILS